MKYWMLFIGCVFSFATIASASPAERRITRCQRDDAGCTSAVLIEAAAQNLNTAETLKDQMFQTCNRFDVVCTGRYVLRAIEGQNSRPPQTSLVCTKGSNGRYYPTDFESGRIVSSTDFNAGHDTLNSCQATLPEPGHTLTCYRIGNGRYYPSHGFEGKVVGSTDFNAGHDSLANCRTTLPATPWDRYACFKHGNGRYYPTNSESGQIVGSTDYQAGHDSHGSCLNTLPN